MSGTRVSVPRFSAKKNGTSLNAVLHVGTRGVLPDNYYVKPLRQRGFSHKRSRLMPGPGSITQTTSSHTHYDVGRSKTVARRMTAIMSALVVLAVVQFASIAPADAHGAPTRPGSRTYLCRIDGTHASGDIQPSNAACAAAVELGGKQPLWDWFGVLRSDGAGRTRGYIPDGQLCSGGEPKYAGYDLARSDWPYTSLTAGADLAFRYNAWAAHPGEFRLYVTKDGYDPTKPLAWDDLEDEPFSVYRQDSPNGNDAQNGTPDYQWNVSLPNKSGPHIIYSVWSRSDSQETFYGCSDVRFDGGNGQVIGIGAGANPVGAPEAGSTPATTVAPNPTGDTPGTTQYGNPQSNAGQSDAGQNGNLQNDAGQDGAMTDGDQAPGQSATVYPNSEDGQATAPSDGAESAGVQVSGGVSIAGSMAATDGSDEPPLLLADVDTASITSQADPDASNPNRSSGETALPLIQAPAQTPGDNSTSMAMLAGAFLGLLAGVAGSIAVYATLKARRLEEFLANYDRNRPQPDRERIGEPAPKTSSVDDDTQPHFTLD